MRKFALLALASAVTLAWGTAQAYTPGIYPASRQKITQSPETK